MTLQRFCIGVDIGGAFTDLVWVDDATGAVQVGKLLTTPKDPSQAVEQGVVTLLNDAGGSTAAALADPRDYPRHQRADRAQSLDRA